MKLSMKYMKLNTMLTILVVEVRKYSELNLSEKILRIYGGHLWNSRNN